MTEYEKALSRAYGNELLQFQNKIEAWRNAREGVKRNSKGDYTANLRGLEEIGAEPVPPPQPLLTCPEPTYEGLCKLFANGRPSLGMFSDEGGQFIGGHGLSPDNRLKTLAGLSGLWDGGAVKRVRSGDGASVLFGRRLTVHLMMQPGVASELLADEVAKDQGFLSRVLPTSPATNAGTRMQREPSPASALALNAYSTRIALILAEPLPLREGAGNELAPRRLTFEAEAVAAWRSYADGIEFRLGPGQDLEPIRGFANKVPENAARVAGVLTMFEDLGSSTIKLDAFIRAVRLMEHYTSEALRVFDAGAISPEIRDAELLEKWLLGRWAEDYISIRKICQFGPNSIRDTKHARRTVATLVDHKRLLPVGPGFVAGARADEAWLIDRSSSNS